MIAIWLLPTAFMSPPLSTTASEPTRTKSTLSMTYATAASNITEHGIPAEINASAVLILNNLLMHARKNRRDAPKSSRACFGHKDYGVRYDKKTKKASIPSGKTDQIFFCTCELEARFA